MLGDALGRWLGENGHTLIYGGATGGLMSRTSDAAKQAGAHVVGVKQRMRDEADIIVCLPGSYGTLDEMMDATSSAIVGEHKKPVFVLNYKGFYEPLKRQIELMKSLQFIPQDEHYRPIFVDTLEELYTLINSQL